MQKNITKLIAVLGIAIAADFGIAAHASAKTAEQRIEEACRYYDREIPGYYPRCIKNYRQYFGSGQPDNSTR